MARIWAKVINGDKILKDSEMILNRSYYLDKWFGGDKHEKEIYESIDSNIYVCLSKNDNILFEDTSKNSGLEIVL